MKPSPRVAVLALLTLAGAVYSQEPKQSTSPPPAASASIDAASFHDTVWKSHNLGTGFTQYLFLRKDGSVGYSETPRNFKYDDAGDDTWKVEKGFLVISWTKGYAREKYRLAKTMSKALDGEKTSKKWEGKRPVKLTRVEDK